MLFEAQIDCGGLPFKLSICVLRQQRERERDSQAGGQTEKEREFEKERDIFLFWEIFIVESLRQGLN